MSREEKSPIKERLRLLGNDLRNLRVPILVIVLYESFQLLVFHALCPVKVFFGLPCPGCGMTRASFFLLTGNIGEALRYHALVIPWVLCVLYLLVYHYVLMKKAPLKNPLLIILGFTTLGYYIYRMIRYYPSAEPMAYHEENLLRMAHTGIMYLESYI
ncbi:MAG: DUF2752 domain-containing protein [Lachnospiraceae bacterium]|nr:DUF2752 domain-containing protein [Lachnospiraceae bacterium]